MERAARPVVVALGSAVLTAVVAGTEIGRPVLWRDELATWSAASRPVPQIWALLRHTDAVIGPYYLALHAWMSVFGDSAIAMRVPSALAMAGAAAVVALIARRLAGGLAGVAAGVIFALIPAVSRYGQEARPYAFAALFGSLATLALLRALDHPGRWPWARYALAMAAAGASSLVTLSLFAAHALAAFVPRSDPAASRVVWVRGFAACAGLAIAIDAPLVIAGHAQAAHQLDGLPHPGHSALVTLWPQLFSSGPAAAVVLLLAASAVMLNSPYRRAAGFAVVSALVPVLVIWVASHGKVSYWATRYLIFTLPAWAVAAGCGVAALAAFARMPAVRYGMAVVVLALTALAGATAEAAIREPQAHNWWTYPAPSGDIPLGYAQAAGIVAAHEQPGDGVAYQIGDHDRWAVDLGVTYYLRNRQAPRVVFEALTAQQAGLLEPVECGHPARCLFGVRRLWVVYIPHLVRGGRGGTPFQALLPDETAALHSSGFRVRQSYAADGITVDLLARSAGNHGQK